MFVILWGVYYNAHVYECTQDDMLLTWGWATVWLGRLGLSWVSLVVEFIVFIVPVALIKVVWSVGSSGLVIVVRLWRVVIRATISILRHRTSIADVGWRGRGVIAMKVRWSRQPMTLPAGNFEGGPWRCVAQETLGAANVPNRTRGIRTCTRHPGRNRLH